jgi:uncharacterized cofD-like protein
VYIANIMTQPGETPGLSLSEHVRILQRQTRRKLIDWVVANNTPISRAVARRYRSSNAEPVRVDLPQLQRLGVRCVLADLLEEHAVVRHSSERLARLLLEEFVRRDPARR